MFSLHINLQENSWILLCVLLAKLHNSREQACRNQLSPFMFPQCSVMPMGKWWHEEWQRMTVEVWKHAWKGRQGPRQRWCLAWTCRQVSKGRAGTRLSLRHRSASWCLLSLLGKRNPGWEETNEAEAGRDQVRKRRRAWGLALKRGSGSIRPCSQVLLSKGGAPGFRCIPVSKWSACPKDGDEDGDCCGHLLILPPASIHPPAVPGFSLQEHPLLAGYILCGHQEVPLSPPVWVGM